MPNDGRRNKRESACQRSSTGESTLIEISVQPYYRDAMMSWLDDSKNMNGVFEAVSHPQRIRILKGLAKTSLGFSELKRLIGVESSGALDFHLKKLGSLVTTDSAGRYVLTREGYSALEAVGTVERYGWQKRAFYINVFTCICINLGAFFVAYTESTLLAWEAFLIVFVLTTIWIAFYSHRSIVRRRIFEQSK
jgi:DNA-binding transcriptional ArsR family regulator